MQEFKQTDVTRKSGNCLQTCVAMLMGLNPDEVPNFNDGGKVILNLENWLQKIGWALMSIPFHPDADIKGMLGVYGFAAVRSKRHQGGLHAIIWRFDRLGKVQRYWDPDPDTMESRFTILQEAVRLHVIIPRPGWYGQFIDMMPERS